MARDHAARVKASGRRLEDRYVLSGFLIVLCIVAFAIVGDNRGARIVAVALQGVTLLVILRASYARPRTVQIVAVLIVLSLLVVALSATSDGVLARAAPGILGAVLALVAPVAIVRRLAQQPKVEFATVAGALCIYLLAGLFFALLFWTIGELDHDMFFAQQSGGNGADYVYYSFVTLTTVGFGDLTARHDLGRICSILEALFGQLYLVSVVALLVSNIGRERRTSTP